MKDIAIYRLQRVEKALERLDAAVSRLESASTASLERAAAQDQAEGAERPDHNGQQLELMETELAALRQDYDSLRKAATSVADRLDDTIARYESSEQAAAH